MAVYVYPMSRIFVFVCFLAISSVSLRVSAPPRSYDNSQRLIGLLSYFFQLGVAEIRSPTFCSAKAVLIL